MRVVSLMLCLYMSSSITSWAASFRCEQDTYIDALYPDDNFGGSDRLLIADSDKPTRALMRFDIPEWVAASDISGAHIVLYSAPWTSGGGAQTDFVIHVLTQGWVEGSCLRYNDPNPDNGATWNQYAYDDDSAKNLWTSPGGAYDSSMSVSGAFPLGSEWGPFSIDVTELVKGRLDYARDCGFLIKHPLENRSASWQNYASGDSSGYDPPLHPYLDIEFVEPPPNDPPGVPADPSPSVGETGVSVATSLSWSCSDPDPDNTLRYDVYFGSGDEPELVSENQAATTYALPELSLGTAYSWIIVARDNYGAETTGERWIFTTVASAITSVYPASASPFYFRDVRYMPLMTPVIIKGEGTHFRFPQSKVSFDDENIFTIFSFPISKAAIWSWVVIGETAKAGFHDVTVTTGDEASVGRALFEVVRFWRSDETVTVKHGDESADVALKGLQVRTFKEKDAVLLSDIVDKSALTNEPENFFYNLIASDNYSLARGIVVGGWDTGLPPWSDMQKGYLYQSPTYELLTGWESDTIGGRIGQAYNVKYMNGGTIELREEDITE